MNEPIVTAEQDIPARIDWLLDKAQRLLNIHRKAIAPDSTNETVKEAEHKFDLATAWISRSRHAIIDGIALIEGMQLGKIKFLNRDDPNCWMGEVEGKLVLVRKSTLGPGETLVNRSGRILVKSYGDSWRNPPYIQLA